VLFGTDSFWQGVDVPGESLSCVVIDKIPFANPRDPIEDAFEELLGRDMFQKRMVPNATIQLKQGFGRAIRRADDRAVIVMLDRRTKDKGYGRAMIRSCGKYEVFSDIDRDIPQFLDSGLEDIPF